MTMKIISVFRASALIFGLVIFLASCGSGGDDAPSSVAKTSVSSVAEEETIKEKIDFKAEGVKITRSHFKTASM